MRFIELAEKVINNSGLDLYFHTSQNKDFLAISFSKAGEPLHSRYEPEKMVEYLKHQGLSPVVRTSSTERYVNSIFLFDIISNDGVKIKDSSLKQIYDLCSTGVQLRFHFHPGPL